MLRQLRDEEGNPLLDNYRPVQELHDRIVQYRKDDTILFPTARKAPFMQTSLIAMSQQVREPILFIMMGKWFLRKLKSMENANV